MRTFEIWAGLGALEQGQIEEAFDESVDQDFESWAEYYVREVI